MTDATVPEIGVSELARRHADGAYILDVRQPAEYAESRVPGARLLPLDELEARHREIPRDREVLVICRSGMRSALAVTALNEAGYRAVNVAGGTMAWVEQGHPVDTGMEAT